MNISYKKQLHRNLLVLSDFNISEYKPDYMVKMLINNNISGLLSVEMSFINSRTILSYDITQKHSLSSILTDKKIDYKLFSVILSGLYELMLTLDKYMLEDKYLLLSPDFIFLNSDYITPTFCYCPIIEDGIIPSFTLELTHFLEYIIKKLDYDDTQSIALCYKLHQKCLDDCFEISDLYSLPPSNKTSGFDFKLDDSDNSSIKDKRLSNHSKDSYDSCNDFDYYNAMMKDFSHAHPSNEDIFIHSKSENNIIKKISSFIASHIQKKNNKTAPDIESSFVYEEDDYFISHNNNNNNKINNNIINNNNNNNYNISDSNEIDEIGETILLGYDTAEKHPHLIYSGLDFSDDVVMDSFPFTVGKLSSACNYTINNVLISRIHARFFYEENTYFVEDLNSSNGTYLNDETLTPHTLTEIHSGDTITFANLSYIFTL